MSACCLLNNPGAARGQGAAAPARGAATAAAPVQAANTPPAAPAPGAAPPAGRGGQGGRGGGRGNTQAASAAAWSSNPLNPPTFYDMPTKDGQPVPAIAAKWVANSPLVMVDQYLTNLKKYHAIMMDVGLQDGL